jgi:hypothetical protein
VKKFVEQLAAGIRGQLAENVAGCVSESSAEAENLLEFLSGI